MKKQKLRLTELQVRSFSTSTAALNLLHGGSQQQVKLTSSIDATARREVCETEIPFCNTSTAGASGPDTNGDR